MGAPRNSAELRNKANIVLVVEDDNEMRELLRIELEAEGFTVLTATNGAQAVGTARSEEPDVILMDVQMPVMNGVEATKILKDDKHTRHIPVIMVTSVEKKEDMIKGLEAGAIDYITKPFFLPELKARINGVLRFLYIYTELITVKEQLIKQIMLEMIKEISWLIKSTVEDSFESIYKHLKESQRSQKYISQNDLNLVENCSFNIKSSVVNLNSLDLFTSKLYQTLSEIVDHFH